jgi:glycosyltransferase involved in cell wall biosynthesis
VLEVNCLYSDPQYHQFEPLTLQRLARRLEQRALHAASVVLAVSTPLARRIEDLVPSKTVVVPNGANPERFDPRRAEPGRARARHAITGLTVGWAGILREWHGVELLLTAVAAVPSITLLIVGDGPARADLERRAAALGIAGRVVVTGRIPHAQMPDYLAAMDIAVVADDRTGIASPMKLLEYMSMSAAVVAPRLENIQDLVTDDVDGLLFAPGDAGDLTRIVRRLAENRDLRERLGRAARSKIERERNWRRNAETVLAIVGDRRPRPASPVTRSLRGSHV